MSGIGGQPEGDLVGESAEHATFQCSYTQARIWFAQQMEPESAHWNVAMRWRLEGRIREAAVERAWQLLLERHESLRTGIAEIDGIPHQRVWSKPKLKFGIIDLSRLPPAQRETSAEEISRKEARTPIVLREEAPLFRVQFIRLDENTAYLLTTFHHIIVDGWSIGVLLREFGEIASQLASGGTVALPEVALQHVDFTLWQADTLESGGFEADRIYWREKLAGIGRFELPTDRPRPSVWLHEGEIRTLLLPRDLSLRIDEFAARQSCTPFHIAIATLAAVTSRAASSCDVVLGTQMACRAQAELAGLVGPLINTVVLRLDAGGDPTLVELLHRARAVGLEALEHQQLPFNFVVDELHQRRDPGRHPVHSISVTTQAAHIDSGRLEDLSFDGLRIVALPSFSVGAMLDLECFMVGREEGWRISCVANTSLFDLGTIDGLLAKWADAIEQLVDAGSVVRISDLAARPAPRVATGGIGSGSALVSEVENASAQPPTPADAASQTRRHQVAAIWKEVLGLQHVDGDTDFFDAGGNSMTAMRMIARIGKTLNRKSSIRMLFANPRLGDFVQVLYAEGADGAQSSQAPVPRVNRGKVPIIALNNGSAYVPLRRRMAASAEIIDVECGDGSDVEFARGRTFLEVVERMTARIRQRQPKGPYTLMGYCGLGQLAFEIGAHMKSQGDEVRLIVLLDASHATYKDQFTPLATVWHKCLRFYETVRDSVILARMRMRNEISTAIWLEHYGFIRATGLTGLLSRLKLIEPLPSREQSVVGFDFIDAILAKRSKAESKRQDLPVALFRSREVSKGWVFPEASGWRPYVGGRLEVFDLDCRHGEMTQDVAAVQMAPRLAEYLDHLADEAEKADQTEPFRK